MSSKATLSILVWGCCLALLFVNYTNSLKTKPKEKRLTPRTHSLLAKENNVTSSGSISSSSSITNGDSTNFTAPVLHLSSRILQIINPEFPNEITVIEKPVNSDLIVGKDISKFAKVILECSAPFPVQWIYSGDGMPEISTNTSMSKSLNTDKSSWDQFTATLGFNRNLQESDTGEYICKNVHNSLESIHYYIYVPGKSLFTTSKTGMTIKIRPSQTFMRIPCSVSDPEILVSLQKKVDGFLQCPNEYSILFSPKSGFAVNFSTADGFQDDPTGAYICIASINGTFQLAEYLVQRINGVSPFISAGNKYHKYHPEGYDDSVELDDIHARNDGPCYPNNPCGPNSQCRQIPGKNLPRCSCLPSYIGRPPNCRPECVLNLDCPQAMACINQHCEDPCEDFCAQGAICTVVNHMPTCECPTNYIGNPNKFGKCGRTRSPSEHYFPTRPGYPNDNNNENDPQSNELITPDNFQNNRHACEPWPCGKFSECRPVGNNAHCSCAPGYIGQPPNCRPELECRRNSDCARNLACVDSTCRDPCYYRNIKCGNKAKCMTINHKPDCFCPSGLAGNPLVKCISQQGNGNVGSRPTNRPVISEFPESPSSSSEEQSYPSQMRPGYPGSGSQSDQFRPPPPSQMHTQNSPCRKSPCGKNAICNSRNQTISCKCPQGFTGFGSDPFQECYPSSNPCEICGPNSECHVRKNRQPICTCLPGKVGKPPHCRDNLCELNSDCPREKSCHQGRCEDPCNNNNNNCGENSVCRAMNHRPVCACLHAPDKDPLYGCPPRKHGEYIIQQRPLIRVSHGKNQAVQNVVQKCLFPNFSHLA